MRILLIEDHLPLVQTLTQSLGVLGIRVEACNDGRAADAALQQHSFDIVVLDLALPRMDGMEILRRLRQRGDTVPVLVLTASGDITDRVQGLNAGADDYLA
jgi:two-component system response regulator TctD